MANTMLAIDGGLTELDEDLEVYIDVGAQASPNFSMPVKYGIVADFVEAALPGLSSVQLSVYDSLDLQEKALDMTALDLLNADKTKTAMEALSAKPFGPDVKDAMVSDVFGKLMSFSPNENWEYTRQTKLDVGAALAGAADQVVAAMESDAQPWRHRISKLVNVNAVRNSLKQIFTWIPGERIINPEFGSSLKKYLYEPITEENQERIVAEIRACVIRSEPRVIVDRIVKATSIDDIEENTVKLDIYYRIKGLSDKQFMYQYEYSRVKTSYI